jgi:hypothetical protein
MVWNSRMRLFARDSPLAWGSLDLPLMGVSTDWHGKALVPPLAFSLAKDGQKLWFVALRQSAVSFHPGARPGAFTPELWKHDVSELFIAAPEGGKYIEFNLAANGAWWACAFDSVREPAVRQPDFASAVETFHDDVEDDCWLAALTVRLDFLRDEVGFGTGSRANAAFILNSPRQTFHSAAKLPGEVPDFHLPASFPVLVPSSV